MSSSRMFEANKHFGAEKRNFVDDEFIKLAFLRLESKLDDVMQAVQCRMERLELLVNEIWASMKSNSGHNAHKTKQRCLNLKFSDKVSSPIRTGDEIKGIGGDYIKVALVDETGNLVDSGPESSAEVQIFAFKGDVDENECCSRGKGFFAYNFSKKSKVNYLPLLVGNVQLKLNKGIGILDNIKFRTSASHVSGEFKIGARVVDHLDGIIVQDAKTVSFPVKDYREKYNEKHRPPCLSDEIWRLDNIGRGGKIHKRLMLLNLKTVEDFLIQLLKDSDWLKKLVDLPQTKWEATVNHALTCQLDKKVYCSISSEDGRGIVINAVGKVLGLIVANRYLPLDELSDEEKVNASTLDVAAFVHKSGLLPFPDEASLMRNFPENTLHPSNCMKSLNTFDQQEDEGSEIGDSYPKNFGTSFEDLLLSSDQPLPMGDDFNKNFLDSLFYFDQLDNFNFSDMGGRPSCSDMGDQHATTSCSDMGGRPSCSDMGDQYATASFSDMGESSVASINVVKKRDRKDNVATFDGNNNEKKRRTS